MQLHADYFKSHLCDIPSLEMEVSKSQLVDMYRQMVSMRRMEMAADQVSYPLQFSTGDYTRCFGAKRPSEALRRFERRDDSADSFDYYHTALQGRKIFTPPLRAAEQPFNPLRSLSSLPLCRSRAHVQQKLIRGFCHLAIGQVRPILPSLLTSSPIADFRTYAPLLPALSHNTTGGRLRWNAQRYQDGRQDHHRLPLPPFRCSEGWNDQGCYR